MNWLKDLKIIQKLLVLISLCVVFIGVVGFVGFHFIQKGAIGMADMYKDNLKSIEQLNECRVHLRANAGNILFMIS